jgi:excinuclease ABC subunit C
MIHETADMVFVTTRSETEALLLEANLIKKLRPRYNVVMRDDKSFPYILVSMQHEAARLRKHRGAQEKDGVYFGPFASAGAVNRTINSLQRAFLIRTCADSVYESRTRPCLLYQIKRCAAPCTGEISLEGYQALTDEALAFLKGRGGRVREELQARMAEAAGTLDFESAASYRDRLAALSQIETRQGINSARLGDADIFAAHQEGGQTCVQVFFVRGGQNMGNRPYFPRADRGLTTAEILDAFLAQFYDGHPAPPRILLAEPVEGRALLEEALSIREGRKVRVLVPMRGEKLRIVAQVSANAREELGRRMAETSSQGRLLAGLAEALELEAPPERIEVYDNSHIQGANAVGGMIVAGPEGFIKGQYRKFNIKTAGLSPGDDYGMMREVLTRRFARLIKETGAGEATDPPDLVLIDGGKAQLDVAVSVLDELGISDVAVASVAKGPDRDAGREHIVLPGKAPFRLEPKDPVLYFIQRLRDEAHRFAIGSHRARRKKAIGTSPLDEIQGIGATRKRALLNHFGTSRAISRAAIADLEMVPGISAQMAKSIYDHFHEQND